MKRPPPRRGRRATPASPTPMRCLKKRNPRRGENEVNPMSTPPPNFIGSLTTLDAHAIYRVNGVAIWENNTLGGENLCSSGPLVGWMVTGPNTIEIEARNTGPKAVVEAQAGIQGED